MAPASSVCPSGRRLPQTVFLDANVIINVASPRNPLHSAATALLEELLRIAARGDTRLYVSPLVFDEVWWKLAQVLFRYQHGEDAWASLRRSHRQSAALIHSAAAVANVTLRFLANPLVSVTDIAPADVPVALLHVTGEAAPQLDPRDAFHLAVMKRLGIEGIVTNDPDFAGAPGIVAIPGADL